MTLETFLLWVAVGAIAGYLASLLVGTGFGVVGDIVIGVLGAFLGGWISALWDGTPRSAGSQGPWSSPSSGRCCSC